jgi:pimeloyl-ACP methyl ester carboxylesterase
VEATAAPLLAQTRVGSGPPLVLLHALGTDRHMWDPVLERLAAEREVFALDMPGFGESPTVAALARDGTTAGDASAARAGDDAPPTPAGHAPITRADHAPVTRADQAPLTRADHAPVTPADLAAAVHAHLSALGLDRPHVAGNSLGGWVALELALAGHARSVTAIAPAGMWAQPLMPKRSPARALAGTLSPVLPALLRSERGRRAALAGTTAHPERIPYAAALQLVRAYANAPGFDAANAGMRAGRFTGLARISVPLTLAWPDHDRLVARPRSVPASASELVLRGCGHMPTWDDPEQVAAVLLRGSRA